MDSKDRWYQHLKDRIMKESWRAGAVDHAFMHGQVMFAGIAGLITKEQMEELSGMIPEY